MDHAQRKDPSDSKQQKQEARVLEALETGERFDLVTLSTRTSIDVNSLGAVVRNLRKVKSYRPRYDIQSRVRSGSTWEYWLNRPTETEAAR